MSALLEVLSVTYYADKEGAPCGTISVFDGKRGQFIYRRGQTGSLEKTSNPGVNQNKEGLKLQLTGPYRAISGNGCITIELDLHHGCQERESHYVAEIRIDVYDDSTVYDVPFTKPVKTCNCHESPSAVVKYALLSDAVEASVEVTYNPAKSLSVHKIIALSDVGEVLLFESNEEEKTGTHGPTIIPLARSVLAVPLDSSLQIGVDRLDHSCGKIVQGFVECQADLNSDRVLHLDGDQNDQVVVKIRWYD